MPPWNRLPSVMPVSVSFPFLNGTWPGPVCLLTLPGSPGTFARHFDCRQGVSQTGKGRPSAVSALVRLCAVAAPPTAAHTSLVRSGWPPCRRGLPAARVIERFYAGPPAGTLLLVEARPVGLEHPYGPP